MPHKIPHAMPGLDPLLSPSDVAMQEPVPLSEDEARDIYFYVIRRAVTDPAFRAALLRDARATLEREFDLILPVHFNIRFVENEGADLTIVLPDPGGVDGALNMQTLEYVAGGAGAPFAGLARRRAL
ncbi:hypothetical protein [Rhodocaloribacter sp.]